MLIYALIDPRDCSPIRVRLSRAKGFRLPENTVVVARPGKWGNVFSVAPFQRAGSKVGGGQYVAVPTLADAIECYTIWLNESVAGKEIAAQARSILSCRHLAQGRQPMSELPGEGPVRHNCPWPGCSRRVLPWFWGCAPHWAMVPKVLASEFLKTRKDGVETQPIEHHMILERINNWTKTNAVADEQRPSTATGEVTGFTAGFCDDGSIMLFWAKEGEYLVLGPTEEQVLRRLLGRR